MSKRGRPRLLADEEKRRTLFAMIAIGSGRAAAARHVGCSIWTISREALRDPEFDRRLREAETSAELMPLQTLRQVARSEWRAAAWLLERFNPEQFGRQKPRAVTHAEFSTMVQQVATVLVEEFSDKEQQRRILKTLQEMQEDCLRSGGRAA